MIGCERGIVQSPVHQIISTAVMVPEEKKHEFVISSP